MWTVRTTRPPKLCLVIRSGFLRTYLVIGYTDWQFKAVRITRYFCLNGPNHPRPQGLSIKDYQLLLQLAWFKLFKEWSGILVCFKIK